MLHGFVFPYPSKHLGFWRDTSCYFFLFSFCETLFNISVNFENIFLLLSHLYVKWNDIFPLKMISVSHVSFWFPCKFDTLSQKWLQWSKKKKIASQTWDKISRICHQPSSADIFSFSVSPLNRIIANICFQQYQTQHCKFVQEKDLHCSQTYCIPQSENNFCSDKLNICILNQNQPILNCIFSVTVINTTKKVERTGQSKSVCICRAYKTQSLMVNSLLDEIMLIVKARRRLFIAAKLWYPDWCKYSEGLSGSVWEKEDMQHFYPVHWLSEAQQWWQSVICSCLRICPWIKGVRHLFVDGSESCVCRRPRPTDGLIQCKYGAFLAYLLLPATAVHQADLASRHSPPELLKAL